jgi:hypothetical protein
VEQHARDHVVTIDEPVGLDDDGVADNTLDWERAAIDLGRHPLDDNPRSAFMIIHHVLLL